MNASLEASARVAVSVYRELLDDGVEMWSLAQDIKDVQPEADLEERISIAEAVLTAVLENGAILGHLNLQANAKFVPWPAEGAIARAVGAWRELGRDPNIGEIGWVVLPE